MVEKSICLTVRDYRLMAKFHKKTSPKVSKLFIWLRVSVGTLCLDHLWTWFFGRRWTIWFRHTWLIYSYAHLISNRFVRKIHDHIGRKTSCIRSQSHLRSMTLTIIYGFLFGWMFFWLNIKCKYSFIFSHVHHFLFYEFPI